MPVSPPIKYHGGKTYLAKWIRSLSPEGRYVHRVHPYGGGLGEFWNWPHEGVSEVVNDIDDRLINLWTVLAEPTLFEEFRRKAEAIPFSQDIWRFTKGADVPPPTPQFPHMGSAIAFFIRIRQSRQGLMKDFATLSRTRTRRGMNEQVSAWLTAVEGLPEVHARLKRVVITNTDAVGLIQQQDGAKTFFYCDPPYLGPERSTPGTYAFEMTEADHWELLATLAEIKGMFALSGYHNPLYDKWAARRGFTCHERQIDNKAASGPTKAIKTECLWVNYDD